MSKIKTIYKSAKSFNEIKYDSLEKEKVERSNYLMLTNKDSDTQPDDILEIIKDCNHKDKVYLRVIDRSNLNGYPIPMDCLYCEVLELK